jgi:membrane-bound lytic murein transglycosylase B
MPGVATTPAAIVKHLHADERGLQTQASASAFARSARERQLTLRWLGRHPATGAAVMELAPNERDDVQARIDLQKLANATPPLRARPRTGPPAPAERLRAWYGEAQRRFGIRWQLLAAINFVESAFGKVRNTSVAGAQGPMQFEPATWRAYGLGGDVHDPHDAILGAANYLRANGGGTDERRALLHYNNSRLYMDAVLRYAHRIATVPTAFAEYYDWQVFVRVASR